MCYMPSAFLQAAARTAFVPVLAFVLYYSLTPAPTYIPPTSDKLDHIVAYFALSLLFGLGWIGPVERRWGPWALLALGGAIEVVQPLAGRAAEWLDAISNGSGVALGAASLWFLGRYAPKWLIPWFFRPR